MKPWKMLLMMSGVLFPIAASATEVAPDASLAAYAVTPPSIKTAIVADSGGQAFGIVQRVETHKGKPIRIDVLMADGREIRIAASAASYDPADNRVISDIAAIRTASLQ